MSARAAAARGKLPVPPADPAQIDAGRACDRPIRQQRPVRAEPRPARVESADLSERPIDAAVKGLDVPVGLSLSIFRGGSSTIVIDRPAGEERIQVEAIWHTGIVYLQIVEETKGSAQASNLSYRLRSADGSPAPAWLRQVGPQTFAGRPDADVGVVDLVLSIIQRDGQVSDHKLQLDGFSGRLSQPLEPQKHGFEGRLAPMFSEQMNEGSLNQNISLLERALGFLQ